MWIVVHINMADIVRSFILSASYELCQDLGQGNVSESNQHLSEYSTRISGDTFEMFPALHRFYNFEMKF